MDPVTPEQCKAVVKETGMTWLGHHKCGGCGSMVGFRFAKAADVYIDPSKEALAPDDLIVGFDAGCDCNSLNRGAQRRSWDEFAHTFNMQTPEARARMWECFKAGKATHESD